MACANHATAASTGVACRNAQCGYAHTVQIAYQVNLPREAGPVSALDCFDSSAVLFGAGTSLVNYFGGEFADDANRQVKPMPGKVSCAIATSQWIFASFCEPMGEAAAANPNRSTAVSVGKVYAYDKQSGADVLVASPDGPGYAHRRRITAMEVFDELPGGVEHVLYTASEDGEIKGWQFNRSAGVFMSQTLPAAEGHVRAVTSLAISTSEERADKENLLISGSDDMTVKIWHIASQACLRTIMPLRGMAGAAPAVPGAPGGFARYAHAAGALAGAGGADGDRSEVVSVQTLNLEDEVGCGTFTDLLFIGYRSGEVRMFVTKDRSRITESPEARHHIAPGAPGGAELTAMLAMDLNTPANMGCPVLLTGFSDGSIEVHDVRSGISGVSLVITNLNVSRRAKPGDEPGHTPAQPVRQLCAMEMKGRSAGGDREVDLFVSGGDDGHLVIWALDPASDAGGAAPVAPF
jgi:hypothetical protein